MTSSWRHGNAARDLRQVLGEGGSQDQLLDLAEPRLALEARRPDVHLAEALDRGREPGEAVGRVLGVVDAARFLDLSADAGIGGGEHAFGDGHSGSALLEEAIRVRGRNTALGLHLSNRHSPILSSFQQPACARRSCILRAN